MKESRPSQPNHADPLIDEVREARRALVAAHGDDVRKLVAALQDAQKKGGRKIFTSKHNAGKRAG